MTQAYPLQWPAHVARTEWEYRRWGSFQTTPSKAMKDLRAEVERDGGTNLVISSNIPVRRDGMPYAKVREPDDPGVAVYYLRKGREVCIPCDTFDRVWKNIRAIGLSIRDMRMPASRGCDQITEAAFAGFTALPPPDQMTAIVTPPPQRAWWEVLGVAQDARLPVIQGAYRALVREAGGATVELNDAFEAAKKERST